ncbi:fimbria/pilus outer membrane usher protein [Fulvimonas yonginensis]|uniref:Fimbria/pilus outer membrane usher protein n=1 Tax=Fulvimonas yonginensis TaxID=1495200 RepID=A0ABU8JCJ8_9GAMM
MPFPPAPDPPARRRFRPSSVRCALLLLALSPGPLLAAVHVRAVRVGMDPDHTRLVLESDKPIRAHLTRRGAGALQLDLDGVDADRVLAGLERAIGANNPFLLGATVEDSATGSRLVLPTRSPVRTRLFNLEAGSGFGERLVLDVFPAPPPSGQAPAVARPSPVAPVPARIAVTADTLASLAQQASSGNVHVSSTRVGIAANRVRLVLESDRPIHARVVHPTTPGPLSVELGDVPLDGALLELPEKIRPNPYLTSVRLEHDASGTRIRLLAPAPVEPQIFNLAPGDGHGDRLVVDVFPERIVPSAPPAAAPTAPSEVLRATPAPVAPAPSPVPAPAAPAAPPAPAQPAVAEAWFEVHVNGAAQDTTLVLQGNDGAIYVRPDDLQQWHLDVGCAGALRHGSDTYCALAAIKGLTYQVDQARGMLAISVPPTLMAESHLSGMSLGIDRPTPSPPGAYLNYDVFAGHESAGSTTTSALLETGLFGRMGSGTSTLLSRRTDDATRTIRLDTTWTHDDPDRMASLRLGDTISGASAWGRSVRMGGVQWATNFATRPTFVTFPLPTVDGVAAAPSTVDYYVNDALRLRREVPGGPFTIQDLPVVTGAGEIRMVVRDMLGREQVISQPFYASSGILARGLRDYSYELGFERRNYGLASNDYGKPVLVGTERRGLTDHVTGEIHAELLQDQQTLGLNGNVLVGDLGVLTLSAAGSHDRDGRGGLLELGFQRQSTDLSWGARSQVTTPGFSQLGYEAPARPPKQMTSAYVSVGTQGFGSFGLNYTRQSFRESNREDIELLGASYSRALGRLGYLGLSALRFLGGDGSTLVSMTFTMPLGSVDSLSLNGQTRGGSSGGTLQYQHNLPAGSGAGWRMQAGLSPDDPSLAELALQNDVGTYTIGAAESQGRQAYQASVQGGIALLAGRVFPSRHIDDSFAVVRVPGFPGVRVYADNQPVAVTDERGYALVPRLRPYQRNPIRIEQADLPLDAEIQGLQLDAVPYSHSAVALTFPVRAARGAVVVVKLEDGSFLPAGATITVEGSTATFPVGYQGEAYLTGLEATNTLRANWRGQSCDMTVAFPATGDPLPRIGPVICKGLRP